MTTPQTPSAPAKPRPDCVPVPLLAAIPEVVREMDKRWRKLQRARDWRAVFAKSYLRTTEQILTAAQGGTMFKNPAWMVQLDCDFAGRYFTAIDCWDAGGACPEPWEMAFAAIAAKRTLVLQDLLLGMNAHINYDLPYALDATIPQGLDAAALEPYAADHGQMNVLLGRTVQVVGQATGEYDPALVLVDVGVGPPGTVGVGQLISLWRARSWAHFLLLRSENRAEGVSLIAQTARDYALLLLQVQAVLPQAYWPNRLYRDSIGWLRGWFG